MGMSFGGAPDDNGDSYKPLSEINVTPMVDVMLVLLIIFMVAAPLMVQGVPLELPKTSAAKLGQLKKPKIVSLSADGLLYIRDEQVTRDRLVPRLLEIKSTEGADGIVYVRADRSIAYGEVMEILGRVGEAGFARVSLLSQPSPTAQAAPKQ
jgi:biopolymer transport protein TolR